MKKRKRDIFTVLETVPNWFEAGEGSIGTSEEIEKGATWTSNRKGPAELVTGETGQEGADWALDLEGPTGQVTEETGQEGTNWALDPEGPTKQGTGEKGSGGVDWASNRGGPTEQVGDEVSLRAAHVAQSWVLYQRTDTETASRSEVQPQPSWTAELNDWLDVLRPPGNRISTESKPVVIEESDDTRSRALNAFWSLLRTACYEEV